MEKLTVGKVLKALPGDAVLVRTDGAVLAARNGMPPEGYTQWPELLLFPGTAKACRLYWQAGQEPVHGLSEGLLELLLADLIAPGEAYWFNRLLQEPWQHGTALPPEAAGCLPVRLSALQLPPGSAAEASKALGLLLPELKITACGEGLMILRLPPERERALEWAEAILSLLSEDLLTDPLLLVGESVLTPEWVHPHGQALRQLALRLYGKGVRGLSGLTEHLAELAGGGICDRPTALIGDMSRLLEPVLKDPELAATAAAFIRNSLSITETAQSLYLHRNTLVYRLGKVEKLTGLDLKRVDHVMAYALMAAARDAQQ